MTRMWKLSFFSAKVLPDPYWRMFYVYLKGARVGLTLYIPNREQLEQRGQAIERKPFLWDESWLGDREYTLRVSYSRILNSGKKKKIRRGQETCEAGKEHKNRASSAQHQHHQHPLPETWQGNDLLGTSWLEYMINAVIRPVSVTHAVISSHSE